MWNWFFQLTRDASEKNNMKNLFYEKKLNEHEEKSHQVTSKSDHPSVKWEKIDEILLWSFCRGFYLERVRASS